MIINGGRPDHGAGPGNRMPSSRLPRCSLHEQRVRIHMAAYELLDLPYDYAALEPHISGKIMELHHDKHHATYVAGVNTALDQLAEARSTGNFGTVGGLEKNLAFNLGGHVNHSVFWPNLSPDGGDKPTADLGAAID